MKKEVQINTAKKEFAASFTKFMIHWSPNTVTEIILNFDEFGLQYKSVPKRSYMTKQEPCLAKKPIRTRVSLFLGTTMSGHKFKPVIIGKAQKPRALNSVDRSTLHLLLWTEKCLDGPRYLLPLVHQLPYSRDTIQFWCKCKCTSTLR